MINIKTYELTTFKVERPDGSNVGESWEYNWYAVRSGNETDRSFYEIIGVTKAQEDDFWSYEPRATFKFLNEFPTETISIFCNVKIIKNGEEVCISRPIIDIVVTEDDCPECLPICNDIQRVTECPFYDELVDYAICCVDIEKLGIDAIEFSVVGGQLVYNDKYIESPYAVNLGPNQTCADIHVDWDENASVHQLSARARKGESENDIQYSELVSYDEDELIPSSLGMSLSSNYLYESLTPDNVEDLEFRYRFAGLILFPTDYNIKVLVRRRNLINGIYSVWGEWQTVYPDSSIDVAIYDRLNNTGKIYDPELTSADLAAYDSIDFEVKGIVSTMETSCEVIQSMTMTNDTYPCSDTIPINTPFLTLTHDCEDEIPEVGYIIITTTTTDPCDPKDDIPDDGEENDGTGTTTGTRPCIDIEIDKTITEKPCFDIEIDKTITEKPCFDIEIDKTITEKPCWDIEIVKNYTETNYTEDDSVSTDPVDHIGSADRIIFTPAAIGETVTEIINPANRVSIDTADVGVIEAGYFDIATITILASGTATFSFETVAVGPLLDSSDLSDATWSVYGKNGGNIITDLATELGTVEITYSGGINTVTFTNSDGSNDFTGSFRLFYTKKW